MKSLPSPSPAQNPAVSKGTADQAGETDLVRAIAMATGQTTHEVTRALLHLLPDRIPAPPISKVSAA